MLARATDGPPSPRHLIAGREAPSENGRTLPVLDPSSGETFGEIARGGPSDVDAAVRAAQAARDGSWGAATALERGRLLHRLSMAIGDVAETLAQVEARDVGKPIGQARADALACARYFEFYAGAADKVHGHTIPYQAGFDVETRWEPHGVTGHIVPWNYPMQIIGRSVGAALAMGNACVVKPGEDASLTALMIARLASKAGLPPGALNVVTGLGAEAGAALAGHPGVQHISFTGSVATGASVQAAAARNVVPVTLELGGKSPQLVFADADIDAAVPTLVRAAVQNAGQTCSAGARVLIERSAYDRVAGLLAERFAALSVGPAHDDLDVGPIVNARQRERVERAIAQGEAEGAVLLARGTVVEGAPTGGFYVAPTLFGDVDPESGLGQEEVFGPVLALMPFEDEEDAVRIANGTSYGLVAGVWTRDGARQRRLAHRLRAGQVFVNNYGAGGGVELPFGGVGKSGHGREKGFAALYGFAALKTVATKYD